MKKLDTIYLRKEQAKLLRTRGMSHTKIAAMTGLTRGIVNNISRKMDSVEKNHGLDERMKNGESCLYCGADIQQHAGTGRSRKFCGDECRRAYWKIHRSEGKRRENTVFTHICLFCGRTFEVYGRTPRKYCSRHCFMLHRNGHKPHKVGAE